MTGSKGGKKSRKDAEKFKISYFQNVHIELKFPGRMQAYAKDSTRLTVDC